MGAFCGEVGMRRTISALGIVDSLDQQDSTHLLLAEHFFEHFPQLAGQLKFSHRWGGPVAGTTRFTATWQLSHRRHVAWVGGYTGLGVGASRFGAQVALDLVDRQESEATDLEMVRRRATPWPPEPIRFVGVQLTRHAVAKADRSDGRRGMWLRTLDRLGLGFDS